MGGTGPACHRIVRYFRNRVFRAFFHVPLENRFRRGGDASCRESTKVSVGSAYLPIACPQRPSACPSGTALLTPLSRLIWAASPTLVACKMTVSF